MDIRLELKLILNQIKADVIDRLIVVTGYLKQKLKTLEHKILLRDLIIISIIFICISIFSFFFTNSSSNSGISSIICCVTYHT